MFFVIFLQRYTFFRNLSRKKVLQFGYKLIFTEKEKSFRLLFSRDGRARTGDLCNVTAAL